MILKYVFWGLKKGIKLINLTRYTQFRNSMTNSTGRRTYFFYSTLFISNRYFLNLALFWFYFFYDLLASTITSHHIISYFYSSTTCSHFSILTASQNYPHVARWLYSSFYSYVCTGFIVLLTWGNSMILWWLFHYPQNLTHIW